MAARRTTWSEELLRCMTRSIYSDAAAVNFQSNLSSFLPIPKLFKFRGKRQRRMALGNVVAYTSK